MEKKITELFNRDRQDEKDKDRDFRLKKLSPLSCISLLIFPPFSPFLLILFVFLFLTGFAGEGPEKLSIPIKAIPKKDREKLENVVSGKTAFLVWRDEEIETAVKVFNYLFDKPILTSTILTELGIASYQIESEAEASHYTFDDSAGLTGELKMLYKKNRERVYQGTYVYTTGAGIPVRLSGDWALILKYKPVPESLNQGNEREILKIDIDLYLKSDEEKLSKITKDLPFIIKTIMLEKVNSYIESLRELCELIRNDPDDVYEVLQESGEMGDKELKDFKSLILGRRDSKEIISFIQHLSHLS